MKEGYFEQLLSAFDLLNAKPVGSLCWSNESEDTTAELSAERAAQYRSGVGKLGWSLYCRPELRYAVKELAKCLQIPTELDWMHLKRVLRYIADTQH